MDMDMETEDISQKNQFSCYYCSKACWSQDKVVSHMEMWTEDEDSLEKQNFKCPYSSQDLIRRDNIIKHMENKHSMLIIINNFILYNKKITYTCSQLYEL